MLSKALSCRKDLKKVFQTTPPSVKAKPRPKAMDLVSHRNLSIASLNSHNANDSEFLGSGWTATMLHSCGKPLQESTESLSLHSQERTQGITSKIGSKHSVENVSSHSIGKPMQGTWNQESSESLGQEYECSNSFGRPLRGTQTQEKKTRPEFRNMEVTNTQYMKEVSLLQLAKQAGRSKESTRIRSGSTEDQYVDFGVLISWMKASESGRHRVSWHVQEHTDQQYWGFVQCYHEFDCGQHRNTKCETSRMVEPLMDKIYVIQWPSNTIDESKSICLLGFSIVLGKDLYNRGCNWAMERPSGNFSRRQSFF